MGFNSKHHSELSKSSNQPISLTNCEIKKSEAVVDQRMIYDIQNITHRLVSKAPYLIGKKIVVVIIVITVNTDLLQPYLSTRSALLPLVDALLHSNHLFNSGIFNEPGSLEPKEAPGICSSFNCFRKVNEVEELLEGLLEFIIVQQSIKHQY